MARIEWVKQRLENWGNWKEREARAGLASPRNRCCWPRVAADTSETIVPVNDLDAAETNTAVESLKLGARSHLYVTLQCYYVRGLGISGTASYMVRSASTVHANLDQADHALAQWFQEREQTKRQARAAALPPAMLAAREFYTL